MEKKVFNPEIVQTINRQTHMLSSLAALPIRQKIEKLVRTSLEQGKPVESVLEEVRSMTLKKVGFQ